MSQPIGVMRTPPTWEEILCITNLYPGLAEAASGIVTGARPPRQVPAMRYQSTAAARSDNDLIHHAYTLSGDEGSTVEVWPALGCNTIRWQVRAGRKSW